MFSPCSAKRRASDKDCKAYFLNFSNSTKFTWFHEFEDKYQDEILSGFNSVLHVILSLTQYGVIGLQTPYYVLSIENESEMSLGFQIRVVKQ